MCKFFFSFLFTLSVFFTAEAQGFSDFSSVTMDGRTISFADYQGKVILVVQSSPISVNAWQCDDFEDMQRCYGDLGFQVLEFLCDDLNEEILPGGGQKPLFDQRT